MSGIDMDRIVNFLYQEMKPYEDSKPAIVKSVKYAVKDRAGHGGYVFELRDDTALLGVCVVNRTGMEDYMPANILVYLAIQKDHWGKGHGTKLLEYALEHCQGQVMLHISRDNPAIAFFENAGFETRYFEMYLNRKK